MKSTCNARFGYLMLAFAATASHGAPALDACGTPPDRIFDDSFGSGPSISAGAETMIDVTASGLQFLPDEHSSFIPAAAAGDPYLFFEAAKATAGAGAIVLQSNDLQTFDFATGYNAPAMNPPLPFTQCAPANNLDLDNEFDENYSGPGSVVQDPTLPAGNLIMVYEGENHCRGGQNVSAYFATAGFARSSDNGKTWPQPAITPAPGATRYPIIGGPDGKPAYDATNNVAVGDAIPSAYVEGSCLYVVYLHRPAPGSSSGDPAAIQIARAQLGGSDPLDFKKYVHSGSARGFLSAGLTGGGADVVPYIPTGTVSTAPTCTGAQLHPGLSFNNRLHRYLLTMVCQVSGDASQLGWFFSSATSLDLEDWTSPQLIANTQSAILTSPPCNGTRFDGWYPSFYTPANNNVGHTGASGIVFYMNGCNTGDRLFYSRPFTVTADAG